MTDWHVIAALQPVASWKGSSPALSLFLRVRERFVTYLEISTLLREVEHANIADS